MCYRDNLVVCIILKLVIDVKCFTRSNIKLVGRKTNFILFLGIQYFKVNCNKVDYLQVCNK